MPNPQILNHKGIKIRYDLTPESNYMEYMAHFDCHCDNQKYSFGQGDKSTVLKAAQKAVDECLKKC